ncbi:ATP-binding cassette domain-containing protein [Bacillus mangrovi]|uniref:ATP-binding cassette domain-containing protein n=1 Tax=Metabacillus mangrovi TaxID=1491830 RepID=A0A7X2V4J2_9BACI|nr:ABC transporter ATP-binding protein [Metabacillus mangrovi]MTH53083.1 ATP-binding cassette domain-containing protein [Metabacillus mangrovi]
MKLFKRLLPFCGPCKRYLYNLVLPALLMAIAALGLARLIQQASFSSSAAIWLGTASAAAALIYLYHYLITKQTQHTRAFASEMSAGLNKEISDKLRHLSVHWYSEQSRQQLMNIFRKETVRIHWFLEDGLTVFIRIVIFAMAGFIFLFAFSMLAGFVSLFLYALSAFAAVTAAAASGVEESLFPIWMKKPFKQRRKRYAGKMSGLPWVLFSSAALGGCLLLYWTGELNAGGTAASIFLLVIMFHPLRQLGQAVQTFLTAAESSETIFRLLCFKQEEEGLRGMGELIFKNVALSYPAEEQEKFVSFAARPGGTVAVFTDRDQDKTAIAHLISGFLKPESGEIAIDGETANGRFSPQSAAVVFEESPMICGTIKANIAFGKLEQPMSTIIQAAKTAQIHDVIMNLPEQYNTVIHEEHPLSRSEIQRIAIARALCTAPGILILENAFSEIDSQTAKKIFLGIGEMRAIKTVILLVNKMDFLHFAERIYVLEAGGNLLAVEELRGKGYTFSLV